jgi:PadR family transcriptional regulator PadR
MQSPTRLEIAALIAVVRLGDEAYGVRIHDDLEGFLGQPVSLAAVYAALERLERRLMIRSIISAPLAVQGGRSKRLYQITATGRSCLRHEHSGLTRLWQALPASFSRHQR